MHSLYNPGGHLKKCRSPGQENLHRANGRGGFASQTAAHPPRRPASKYCDSVSQNANPASTFELSQCKRCKGGLPGPRRGFWCPPAVCPPERPRPFTHYREKCRKSASESAGPKRGAEEGAEESALGSAPM